MTVESIGVVYEWGLVVGLWSLWKVGGSGTGVGSPIPEGGDATITRTQATGHRLGPPRESGLPPRAGILASVDNCEALPVMENGMERRAVSGTEPVWRVVRRINELWP